MLIFQDEALESYLHRVLKMKTDRMKKWMIIFCAAILMTCSHNTSAQSTTSSFDLYAYLGYPVLITSGTPTFAMNGGIGVGKVSTKRFSLEGQVYGAYFNFNRQSGVAQDGGYVGLVTLNGGGRYYWNAKTSNHPVYTNLMLGGGLWSSQEYNADDILMKNNALLVGLSSGTYVAINQKIITGMAVNAFAADGLGNFILSGIIGFQF